jgi:ankyrin repeat protein
MSAEYQLSTTLNTQKDGRTALHWAASTGSIDIARLLIDQNAEVDKTDGSGWTPLHIAGSPLNSIWYIVMG